MGIIESHSQYLLQVGFAPVNSQPKAELVSAGNGHSPLFSINTQKMELPFLLLQVRDSQLFPGPGWGQEDGEAREEEERHLHGGAQASTRTSQPLGTKFSGCLKAWSWAVEIGCFSIDLKNRDLATDSCGFRARGLRALQGLSHNKGEGKEKERKGDKMWKEMRNGEMKLCSFSSLGCPDLRH